MSLLENDSHYGVQLSEEELARIALWIDLLVPYCGDYTEAMNEALIPKYLKFATKRARWQAQEAANIEQWLKEQE